MPTEHQLSDVLSEFARTLVTDFPIQGILEHLVRRIVEILPITAAGVTIVSPTASPRYVAASDDSALRYEELQSAARDSPCLTAYRTGETVIVPDLRDHGGSGLFAARALEAGLAAVFAFPLHQGERVLGALDLYRDTPGLMDDDEMAAAQTLADVTAAYLVNAEARADLQDSSARFHKSAMHDALTGLPNRILLLERLEHALLRSSRSARPLAVLFIDLDHFKKVNDNHGHIAGDELLVAVTERITALLRPGDTLARLSGDEFVILCEELDEEAQAAAIARRIVLAIGEPFALTGATVDVSASIGLAFGGHDKPDPEELLREADIAMYQVKRKGGASHQVIDLREQLVAERWSNLERDLDHAVARRQLRNDYQPIIRAVDGRVFGAEALVRWDHPGRGEILPSTLIPLAEQSGIILALGRWVLEQACTDRHRWGGPLDVDPFVIAVNVSARQLMAPGFVAMVAGVLARTTTDPANVILEITENAFVHDAERALVVLTELKRLGVRLALDDFGTGYSSLNYLDQFPVDVVKLDQCFTARLGGQGSSGAIVLKIIELAHLLELTVVSEGVETSEQQLEVTRLGADLCQGFHLARPMSADLLDEIMRPALTA